MHDDRGLLLLLLLLLQVSGVTDAGLKPRKLQRVAVLGGGLMGSGIATALVLANVEVLLKEVNQQFLDVSVKGFLSKCCSHLLIGLFVFLASGCWVCFL